MSEVEISERIAMSKGKRSRMQMLQRKRTERAFKQQAAAKILTEQKYRRRQEQQGLMLCLLCRIECVCML